jgi:hypothetical protein
MITAGASNLAAEPPGGLVKLAVSCLGALLLLAGCAADPGQARTDQARGTVTGRMVREGGPLGPGGQQPGTHPMPGTVRFTSGRHQVIKVQTSRLGTFSVQLPPGRYLVSDRSPRLLLVGTDGISRQTWSRPVTVVVTAHHITRVTLASIVP